MHSNGNSFTHTAPLSAALLAALPLDYRELFADYQTALALLADANDAADAAKSAETQHRAEITAAAMQGRKIPAAIPSEVFAVKLKAAQEASTSARQAVRRTAAALDDALKVTGDAPEDAPGHVAARFLSARLADAITAEREALDAARIATATRESAFNDLRHALIIQRVGADTGEPGTVRFGYKATNVLGRITNAISDPSWEIRRNAPTAAEAFRALKYEADLAHKALLILAPEQGDDATPERVTALKSATVRDMAEARQRAGKLGRLANA